MADLVHYNLYLNRVRDVVIIAWLEEHANKSKSQTIREALQHYLEQDRPIQESASPTNLPADFSERVYQAITQAMDERQLSLSNIRQAIEAAIGENVLPITSPAHQDDDDADWFDNLDSNLVIE